jgi:hypothetical protein
MKLSRAFVTLLLVIVSTDASADHMPSRKFAVLATDVEMIGIVADATTNSDIYLLPDPSYRDLLIRGNTTVPGKGDDSFPGWKNLQDKLKTCQLSPTEYPEPYPIVKLETYGIDGHSSNASTGGPPSVLENGQAREVKTCDHIRVRGLYVIDYSHTMYYNLCTDSFSYMRGLYKACYPHVELHPYDFESVQLVSPLLPATEKVERHAAVVPFYDEYYSGTYAWNWWGVAGRVVDPSKRTKVLADWYITAPPRPVGGCCILRVTESVKRSEGAVNVTIDKGAAGARVRVMAVAGPTADYRLGGTLSYELTGAAIYQATYTLKWECPVCPPPPPPPQPCPKPAATPGPCPPGQRPSCAVGCDVVCCSIDLSPQEADVCKEDLEACMEDVGTGRGGRGSTKAQCRRAFTACVTRRAPGPGMVGP